MRVKIFFSTLLLLMINIVALYAQSESPIDGPCGLNDDDNQNCPLDTWVVVLAIIAVIFAAIHLHKKKKRATPNIQG